MAIIVGAVTGLQQRHHPQNIPHLVEKIKGFPLKAKSFRNIYCNISKTAGRGSFNLPPPLPLCHGGGMNCVYVRGLGRRLLFTVEGYEDVSVWKMKGGPLGIKFLFYTGLSPAK